MKSNTFYPRAAYSVLLDCYVVRQEIPCFYGTRHFILFWANWNQAKPVPPTVLIALRSNFTSWSLPMRVSNQNVVWIPQFRNSTCPSHLILLFIFHYDSVRDQDSVLYSSFQKTKCNICIFFQDCGAKVTFLFEQLFQSPPRVMQRHCCHPTSINIYIRLISTAWNRSSGRAVVISRVVIWYHDLLVRPPCHSSPGVGNIFITGGPIGCSYLCRGPQKKNWQKMSGAESESVFLSLREKLIFTWKRIIAVFLHTAESTVKTLFVSFQTVLISSQC
jgi:hypothetical protein